MQLVDDPDKLSEIKKDFAASRLHSEWNSSKRLLHATIIVRRDGREMAVVDYWGDGLIGVGGKLFRLERDPFLRIREANAEASQDVENGRGG